MSRKRPGGKSEIRRYRWQNRMPINAGKDALQVNWLSMEIIRAADGKVTYRNSFITSMEVTEDNVERLSECGRCRWRIENESFNILKNNGYHMEHNFGHGRDGLSNLLLAMNLLAFAFHAACDLMCELWRTTRSRFSRRHRFFVTIEVLNYYMYFENWHHLLSAVSSPRAPP